MISTTQGRAKRRWQAVKSELKIWQRAAFPGLVVIIGILVARGFGLLQFFELAAFDQLLRLRPPEPMDDRIVIVGITEQDIRRIKYPVPDGELAALIQQLKQDQPAVIGLDIVRDQVVEPGHAALKQVFRTTKTVIGTEVVLPDRQKLTVSPPPALPSEQVGFADNVLDPDGHQRRSLLWTRTKEKEQFSFCFRLAESYLAQQGIDSDNGFRDPDAIRFGKTELTRVQPQFGGYVNVDAGGNQILLNVRSSPAPFRVISLNQLKQRQVPSDWIRGKIVIIGMMAASVKDLANSGAISGLNPGHVYGIELQAHATSQIISAVLDNRPLLQVWPRTWEIVWIVGWGIVGISLGRFLHSTWKMLLGWGLSVVLLMGSGYGFILYGWWIPIVPAFLVLMLNGVGLTAALFYRHEQELQLRLEERQFVIEQTFNAIHSGPLQSLVGILKTAREQNVPSQLLVELQRLRQEMQDIYGSVQQETTTDELLFRMGGTIQLALQAPLHELLYKAYCDTLERDLPYLKTIKYKIVQFEPLDSRHLHLNHKRGLYRFLEEALCNVGKHAKGATHLTVICIQEKHEQVICVIDNGTHDNQMASKPGLGTQLAKTLAKQLGGTFRRDLQTPRGMMCELRWPARKRWFG